MKRIYNKIVETQYNNIIEALALSLSFRSFMGLSVLYADCTPNNKVVTRISKIGIVFYIIWGSVYIYCTCITYTESQSLIRSVYETKLKQYGDAFEWVACIAYTVYGLWKIPFDLNSHRNLGQNIIDIDLKFKDLGTEMNYNKNANFLLAVSFGQFGVFLLRFLCLWVIFQTLNMSVPSEKIFQVVGSDSLALVITTYYCYYLIMLSDRLKWINEAMTEIKMNKPWVFKVLVRNKAFNTSKVAVQERTVTEKIKLCSKIYGMLFKATEAANKSYGLALVLTFALYLNLITLYMFYFMEATATGLFHDVQRYIDLIILFLWQCAYALTIIFLNVYFCEAVKKQAVKISFTTHEILNGDFEPNVASEAMQFSTQILHQAPVLTACGLFKLDFELLRGGAQTVTTYLIILLQFAIQKT